MGLRDEVGVGDCWRGWVMDGDGGSDEWIWGWMGRWRRFSEAF